MAGNDASAKFFEALNESYDALIDTIKAANERGHRVSVSVIEDAQRGQREAVDLAKKWIDAPLDIAGFYSALLEATTKAQSRSLDVTRQWFTELGDAQKETREVLQRMANANRTAGEAAVDLARGAFNRTGEVIRSAGQVATAATNAAGGDGRRTTREPAKAAQASGAEADES